jgi:hypothetical protein
VPRATALLFNKLQDRLVDTLNNFTSQLDDRLKDMDTRHEQLSEEMTTRFATLEQTLNPPPAIPDQVLPTIQQERIPLNNPITQYMERLDEHMETLSSAVINLQQKTINKPTKSGKSTKSRRHKHKHSSKRSTKSSSSSPSSEDIDSGSTSSDSESMTEDDEEKQNSWLGSKFPGLTELRSQSSRFRYVRSYRAYRLKHTSQRYNQKVAGTLSSLAKKIRPSISELFNGTDPISILTFLISFKRGCDHSGVSEGAAPYLLAYFMEGTPKREMNTYTSPNRVSYCEAVHNLLSNYASEEVLSNEYLKLQRIRQKVGEDERAFSRRVRSHADRMGTLYTSRQVIEAYVDGLLPTVRGLY